MKICFVTSGDINILATMKKATGLAEYLVALNHEVSIIALDCKANRARFLMECPSAKILYYQHGNFIQERNQKKKLVNQEKPDLVYVSSLGFRNWIHRFNSDNSHTKYIVEHSELTSTIANFSIFRRVIYRLFEYSTKFIYDGQIAASKFLYNHFTKGMSSSKKETVLYLPYAFNKNIFQFDPKSYQVLQKRYKGYKIVLFMGTLRENYGFLDLIKTGELLKQQNEKIKILIIGNGDHKQIGIKLIEEKKLNDIVELIGFVDEQSLGPFFKLADVFVSPLNDSIQDWARCPGKLFIYSAFNKPVVTCAIGEALELFPESKFFYKSGNVKDMANRIYEGLMADQYNLKDNSILQEWESRAKVLNDWAINKLNIN